MHKQEGSVTVTSNKYSFLFVFSSIQDGVQAFVSVTEQQNEFEEVIGLAERFVIPLHTLCQCKDMF